MTASGRGVVALASKLARSLAGLIVIVLLGGFAAAALVRYSPGFDVDENAWNTKGGSSAAEASRVRRAQENELLPFYWRYLKAAVKGDFGESESYRVPVAELLQDRAPVTGRLAAWGVAGGILMAALCGWLAVWPRVPVLELVVSGWVALLLAVPPAVLALAFFFREAPIQVAVALAILPRVFGTIRAILRDAHESPALLAARSRGLGTGVLAWRYVLVPMAPRIMALAGVAAMVAFGALVPIEALCDVPGIGQLAWKAALSRDLPLLSALTLIVTFVVASIQAAGELMTPETIHSKEVAE